MRQWADDISVTDDDIEYLTGLLLEREIPLTIDELAHALVAYRLEQEAAEQRERFKDTRVYNPAQTYEVGQKVYFPALEYRVGTVKAVRPGDNAEYGDFAVIAVEFEEDAAQEFATSLTSYHKLSDLLEVDSAPLLDGSADELYADNRAIIVPKLEARLREDSDLVSVAGKWFSRGLMLDVNEGHLNLAEAVLYTVEGGPMSAEKIAAEIGGVSDTAPFDLQVFCLNDALNQDKRFDEVGPIDSVLWYLRSFEPAEVLNPPNVLKYNEIDYDPTLLTTEQVALESEIDDEWSPEAESPILGDEVTLTLNYAHWRAGTLPLNTKMRHIFPTARRTQRIAVTLVDGQDGESYAGWVVRPERFVYGLETFYRKHKLPIGAYVIVRRVGDKIEVDFRAHRPHTEWVRVVENKNNQITFEEERRAIGAEYDDLMILWADEPTVADSSYNGKRPLTQVLRTVAAELTRSSPQGTVHAKTLYSAANVLRRCSPGAVFATLIGDPEFQYVGNHYWRFGA
ncbi:MAG: hypothetical protein IAE80_30560 [Anaerolinea sp.]|nr:hypothetical protein [Anaerolinea sp.]